MLLRAAAVSLRQLSAVLLLNIASGKTRGLHPYWAGLIVLLRVAPHSVTCACSREDCPRLRRLIP